jgi:hypothetical protein
MALMLLAADVQSAESNWSFKKLMPSFGQKNSTPRGLYPEPKKPSVWSRMNRGTKSFVAKSKDAVPSWLMPQTQDRVKKSVGTVKQSKEAIGGEVKMARRNFFAPWSQPKTEEKRPETVPDFLALPKPE